MSKTIIQPEIRELDSLDPSDRPPIDRYCDVVLDGGVINGVVYPGFLIELARNFHFQSIGGTSVGAIAAALAAACEYNRRFGSDNGFNQGLAKMPGELADWVDDAQEVTKIQSLFQPDLGVKRLFDWFVDVLGERLESKNKFFWNSRESTQPISVPSDSNFLTRLLRLLWTVWSKAVNHLGPNWPGIFFWFLLATVFVISINYPGIKEAGYAWQSFHSFITLRNGFLWEGIYLFGCLVVHPIFIFIAQCYRLIRLPGYGACTGMRSEGSEHTALSEWLYDGVQKSAGLPLHRPLTFADLWRAPGGPVGSDGGNESRSIDLRTITTCLSHGRIYELPLANDETPLMFRLSEFKSYFPKAVIDHLRCVSKPVQLQTCRFLQDKFTERAAEFCLDPKLSQNTNVSKLDLCKKQLEAAFAVPEDVSQGFCDPDIRELPNANLPIVVAARLSMSVPILFQNMPLLGFNFDKNAEDITIVRLWFTDGGLGSNFPIHLFDKPIPRWPTFGMKILDDPPRRTSSGYPLKTYLPYGHKDGAENTLLFPMDESNFSISEKKGGFSAFYFFLKSMYFSTKDGHDQSFLRMPDVRNRVLKLYMNNRSGNSLNLKIAPEQIIDLALKYGAEGGRNAAQAYLAQIPNPKYSNWVNLWQDHRWVRLNMLINGMRDYLKGFGYAVNEAYLPGAMGEETLMEKIQMSSSSPPLQSRNNNENILTTDQSNQLISIVESIQKLEQELQKLNLPQPYVPLPMPVLRFKPRF